MNWEAWVTVSGAAITALGTAVTLRGAFLTRGYRDQVKFDIRKIHLAGAVDDLRRSQDEIRKLPTSMDSVPRGLRVKDVIKEIRARFDGVMGILAAEGPDGDIRMIISNAQVELNEYEVSFDSETPDAQKVYGVQRLIQDAVSSANSRIFQLEGKA